MSLSTSAKLRLPLKTLIRASIRVFTASAAPAWRVVAGPVAVPAQPESLPRCLLFPDDDGVTLPQDLDAISLLAITDVAERARRLAQAAHAGQVDKAGNDYYESHLVDVCRRVVSYGGDAEEQAAAWLHDVVEDTAVTEPDLLAAGFSDKTMLMVHLMTKQEAEDPEVYYARLRAYDPARRLKLDADMASNSDPGRLALLDEARRTRLTAKYAKGKALLAPEHGTADQGSEA